MSSNANQNHHHPPIDDTASIGEEMDENFLFNDTSSLNRGSVTSLASSTTSDNLCKLQQQGASSCPRSDLRPQPSRPKSFSIHRLFKKHTKEHQSNCACDDCSSKVLSKTVSNEVPKIRCTSYVSAPVTPINHIASSWTYGGYNSPLKHNSSFSSVDEEDPAMLSGSMEAESPTGSAAGMDPDYLRPDQSVRGTKSGDREDDDGRPPSRSKSRLSLNLISSKQNTPSPRLIPKFLRSSFSRLLQKSNQEKNSNNLNNNNHESEQQNSPAESGSLNSNLTSPQDPHAHLSPMTPSTLEYLEEAKMSGLPVIPFGYPTCVLVDRLRSKTKDDVISTEKSKTNANETKNKSTLQYEDETFPRSPPGTLESIMGLAKEQLRAEQPFEDFDDDDFYCGSMGSTHSSSTHFQSLPNDKTSTLSTSFKKPRPHHHEGPASLDHKRRTWHDYIDMGSGSPRHGRRSIPIRIEGHQY